MSPEKTFLLLFSTIVIIMFFLFSVSVFGYEEKINNSMGILIEECHKSGVPDLCNNIMYLIDKICKNEYNPSCSKDTWNPEEFKPNVIVKFKDMKLY